MTPERWQEIERLYHLALEHGAGQRADFLARSCGQDEDLRKEVESLLASDEGADAYLQAHPADLAAQALAWDEARRHQPGQTVSHLAHLGRYQIAAELGTGGMGTVYRGTDPAIGRPVAIKVIAGVARSQDAAKLRERLRREARAAGALDHPNIVTVFDVGEDEEVTYIVMEFIQGVTLDELIQQTDGLLPSERALTILAEAARALDFAHARGVIHRDIKPGNIMVRADGSVKLTDFGIASVPAAATLTAPGDLPGTPSFISPEQLRGLEATARSDQFSLAVVAWMLLTGSKPFEGEHVATLLASIAMKEPEPSILLSTESDHVLRRALEKDPALRFASCSKFVEALQGACRPAVATSSPREKLPLRWIGVITAGVILAISLIVFLRRLGREAGNQAQKTAPPGVTIPAPQTVKRQPPPTTPSVTRVEPLPQPGKVRTFSADGLPYVWIPAGSFAMGCSPDDRECADDERPSHNVVISHGFWIGQTETTVMAYKRFARVTGRPMPPEPMFEGRPLNRGWHDDRQPIVGLTWGEGEAYCKWAGMRLPSEAEWEYAARGGDFQPRYGTPDAIAWYADNSGHKLLNSTDLWHAGSARYLEALKLNQNGPHAVAEKAANAFGLRDTLGNVWEWVNDWYAKDYYAGSPDRDPSGPSGGALRVLRGGSWYNGPRFVRVTPRHPNTPETRSVYNGIRCAGDSLSDKS